MKLQQLTFTRFLAAIAIVIYHFGRETSFFKNKYFSFLFNQLNVGVSYFFILSGFVMIIAYGHKKHINFFDYLKNRIARIYPVYILAIFILLFIAKFKSINFTDLIYNVLMVQSWVPNKALTFNFPGWSISVELFFYMMFPLLLNRIYSKFDFRKIAVIICSAWFLSQILYHLVFYKFIKLPFYSNEDFFYFPLIHLNQFLIGNLAGLYFLKNHNRKIQYNSILIFITLSLFILLLKFHGEIELKFGLLAIIFVPFILLLSWNNGYFSGLLSSDFLVFLGEISYSIYILHFPVWTLLDSALMQKYLLLNKISDHHDLLFFVKLLILIVLSSISYLYFEKPLREIIKNKLFKSKELIVESKQMIN